MVGVIGCGGTGSATAMLLARLGVGKLLLIDKDVVEVTNINRLHGASLDNALKRDPKVDVVKKAIESIGLGNQVVGIQSWVDDIKCRDALKSCDIIFGCSDDNQGRLFLNRFAYYYLVPVFDMGLAIEIKNATLPYVQSLDGRVTVLYPGNACLLCRGVINLRMAMSEALRRSNPAEFERQKEEAYVLGEGEPNPAVVTFTTEVATMAVNEMLHRLQGFRGVGGSTAQRTRLFHRMHDLRPGEQPSQECGVCGSSAVLGRGDVEPFLDRVD
jgi:molybdopterin/thiamine biosynthesis adenylyltransferase